jgi:hypothetical protein
MDKKKAFQLFAQSAVAHDPFGLMAVANMYKSGDGVTQSRKNHMIYMLRAAYAGNSKAMGIVAEAYKTGEYLDQDLDEAIYWMGLKAEAEASIKDIDAFRQNLLAAKSVSEQEILDQIPAFKVQVLDFCEGLSDLYSVDGIKNHAEQLLQSKGLRIDDQSPYTYRLTLHGDVRSSETLRTIFFEVRIMVPTVIPTPDGGLSLTESCLQFGSLIQSAQGDGWGNIYPSRWFKKDLRGTVLGLFDLIDSTSSDAEGTEAYQARIEALNPAYAFAKYHEFKSIYPYGKEKVSTGRHEGIGYREPIFYVSSTQFYEGAQSDLKQAWKQAFQQSGGVPDETSLRYYNYIYNIFCTKISGTWVTFLGAATNYVEQDSIISIEDKFYRSPTSYNQYSYAFTTTDSDEKVMSELKKLLVKEAKMSAQK